MEFKHEQPFIDQNNNLVTMKSLRTVHGTTDVQVYENDNNYKPNELRSLTGSEMQMYLNGEGHENE